MPVAIDSTDSNDPSDEALPVDAEPVSPVKDMAFIESHKDVQGEIIKLWTEDALNRSCKMSLKRLTADEMCNLKSPPLLILIHL